MKTTTNWKRVCWDGASAENFVDGQLVETEISVPEPECPPINCLLRRNAGSQRLIVFLPAVLPAGRERNRVRYELWKYSEEFDDYNLLYLSDPSLKTSGIRRFSYGIHRDFDGARGLGLAILAVANLFKVPLGQVSCYGSSQGGFLALQVAAIVPGAAAIVQVPRLNILSLPDKTGLEQLRTEAVGSSWSSFGERHPERIDVLARFRVEGRVPRSLIVTNRDDYSFSETMQFVNTIANESDSFNSLGSVSLEIQPDPIGHAPVPLEETLSIIKNFAHKPTQMVPGRSSAVGGSELVESAAPPPGSPPRHFSSLQISPHTLSAKTEWFSLDSPLSNLDSTFHFEGATEMASRAGVIIFSITGAFLSDMKDIKITYSPNKSVRWYAYINAKSREFSQRIFFNLPDHCKVDAIGFRLWHYEGGDMQLTRAIFSD